MKLMQNATDTSGKKYIVKTVNTETRFRHFVLR